MTLKPDLTPAVLAALAAELAKSAKDGRIMLDVGEHSVHAEVTLAIDGSVTVSEDEIYTPTTSIPLKLALALTIRYAGITGPLAMNALVRAMTEALTIDALTGKAKKTAEAAISELADLDAAEARVLAGLAELPKKSRMGKVKVVAKVEVLAASGDALVAIANEDAAASEDSEVA